MELESGTTLGRYRLDARIGEGGMGVVWRAVDTSLGRPVAIKLLPERFGRDPERVARFEREARVLASLNHPNIAAIHGVESERGSRFLVLELVAGETLSIRSAGRRVPTSDALGIALQIARALEAAHERGVVHRDLKPQNVHVDPEGNVKLLDFGLARALEPGGGRDGDGDADGSRHTTIAPHLTAEQTVLGTPSYMSPEQARGRPVDRRADIWAFGVVLFELLSGEKLFEARTAPETLAAVLTRPVPWDRLPADLPPAARTLLERCLERDPRQRLQDIGEARIALERALDPSSAMSAAHVAAHVAAAGAPRARPSWRLWLAPAVALLVAGLAVGAWLARDRGTGSSASTALRRFRIAAPGGAAVSFPELAPDGGAIAYVSADRLWLQQLDRLEPRDLGPVKDVVDLFWSPDSRHVAYLAERQVVRVDATSGESRNIATLDSRFALGAGGTWLDDGSIAITRSQPDGLLSIAGAGGTPTTYALPDSTESDFHDASALPGGRGVLAASHRRDGRPDRIVLLQGNRRRTLLDRPGQTLAHPVYAATGHLLFEQQSGERGVYAVRFSLTTMRTTGAPFLISAEAARPSASRSGDLAMLEEAFGALQFAWVDLRGAVLDTTGPPIPSIGAFELSRDGTQLVTAVLDDGERDLWVLDLRRQTWRRLTFDSALEALPAWSPSGTRIAYQRAPGEFPAPQEWHVVVRNADGSGAPRTVLEGGFVAPGFDTDESLVVATLVDTTGRSLHTIELAGDRRLVAFPNDGQYVFYARPSPDGRYLAYVVAQEKDVANTQVFLRRLPPAEGFWQVSTDGGLWPSWSSRSDRLYYVRGEDVMEVDVELGETPRIGTPKRLFTREPVRSRMPFTWTPMVGEHEGRLLLLRPAARAGSGSIELWQNWTAIEPARR
jgi:hypothetical protein